jgi:hypothetical protein
VLSYDTTPEGLRARAFFVALREPMGPTPWRCVSRLPGFDASAIRALLPFDPAAPRSAGVSLHDDGWTLYFKPRSTMRAPETLEPSAIYRIDGNEVGVFIEPTEHAARAFRRTARSAVSVRVREGAPTSGSLESLVDWFAARLDEAEKRGSGARVMLEDPPSPWGFVDAGLPAVFVRLVP